MEINRKLRILFIGNSHTYFNDLPHLVQQKAAEEGFDCEVTMLAHPNWFLAQHVEDPEARFNIRYGNYDYVILQEHAHPFGPVEKFRDAVVALSQWITEAGSVPVIYECWAEKEKPENQDYMNEVHRQVAGEVHALLAPVGEHWWEYQTNRPEIEMYAPDGGHASSTGSEFAAGYIWETVREDLEGIVHSFQIFDNKRKEDKDKK